MWLQLQLEHPLPGNEGQEGKTKVGRNKKRGERRKKRGQEWIDKIRIANIFITLAN